MPMTLAEQILSGAVLALGGGLIGRVTGLATFNRICKERQTSCTVHVCGELTHIKDDLKEARDDIKTLLKNTKAE